MSLSHRRDGRSTKKQKKPSHECGVRVSATVAAIERLLVEHQGAGIGAILSLVVLVRELITLRTDAPSYSVERVSSLLTDIDKRLRQASLVPMTMWPGTAQDVRAMCKAIDEEVRNW